MKCSFLIITGLFSASICCAQTNKILETGNVGIGTTNPEAKLNIVGVEEDAGGNTFMIGTINSSNLRMGVNTGYSWIQSHGGKPLSINELGNNVVINPFSGNLGVGTINPQAKLDVKGAFVKNEYGIVSTALSVYSSEPSSVGTGGAIALGGNSGNSSPIFPFAYIMGGKESNFSDNYAGYFAINTVSPGGSGEANSGNYERLRITAIGNVGIGTSTPNEKLSVNGKIRTREIKVETANWPDYVFLDEYKKMSLSDLEKFIKAYKHLPEMPTATEAERDGIDLGRISKNLVKQQEELVLHLIEKDQEIQKLKTENLEIKEKLSRILKSLKLE